MPRSPIYHGECDKEKTSVLIAIHIREYDIQMIKTNTAC